MSETTFIVLGKVKSRKKAKGRLHMNIRSGRENLGDTRKKMLKIKIVRSDKQGEEE